MPEKWYIVGQLKKAETGCVVMERKMIGEVEVYAEIVPAANAAQAAQIVSALNAQHEAEIRAEEGEVRDERVGFRPLYAVGPHAIGVQVGEVDIEKTVQQVYDDGNPGLAFALAEANGYAFQPDHLVLLATHDLDLADAYIDWCAD